MFLVVSQGWASFSVQEVSRRNWVSVPGSCQNSPFPSSPSPPPEPGRPPGSSLCCPWSYLQEMLLALFRPFSSWDGGGRERRSVSSLGVCFCCLWSYYYFLWKILGWTRISPYLYWILQMVFPLRKEEGKKGNRILGSVPALPSSAGLCSRLTPTHEKLQSVFVGKRAPHLGFPDHDDLWWCSHCSSGSTCPYSVWNS